jgi:hypothetical protein
MPSSRLETDGRGPDAGTGGGSSAGPLRLAPGALVTVRLDKHPRPDVRYPATVLADDGEHAVVRAPWAGAEPRDFGFVRFGPGDIWTEHYWRTRWYSIKEVVAADGTVKGWYCDVARPALVATDEIVVADLDLDLWLSGDGQTVLRLDEDEFAESGLAEREPATAAAAQRALDELAALAAEGFAGLLEW